MVIGGVFWSATYILIIVRGFKDKTFGMPFVALCANIAWEAVFSFVHPHSPPQLYVDYAWFFLDCVIVFQFFRFGPSELRLSKLRAYPMFAGVAVAAGLVIYFASDALSDWHGAYVAFGQNLVMSVLFIGFIRGRKDLRGQSLPIALLKMTGTAIASGAFYLYQPISHQTIVLPVFFVSIFAFDLAYTILVYQKCRKEAIPRLRV